MEEKVKCGNCGWDGTPLNPQNDAMWGKAGEWVKYKQFIPSNSEDDFKGILVFYIDVGQLPPQKAEEFVGRMKDSFRSDRLSKNFELIFVPVRPNSETRVEYISVKGK